VLIKSGSISSADIMTPMTYQIADGSLASCQRFNLKSFELDGGISLHNIAASVSESHTSPLLLGQNVLAQLGNVRIDYANGLLVID
jgi:predicted aspartyl protease